MTPNRATGQSQQLQPGDRIRIFYSGSFSSQITGLFQEFTDGSLRLATNKSTEVIPLAAIKRVDISVGKKTNEGKGAAIGAISGGLAFGLLSMASDPSCGPEDDWCIDFFSSGQSFAIGFGMGAAGGAFIGLIAGGLTKSDRWKRIPLDIAIRPVSLRMVPSNNQVGLNLRWSF